LADTLGSLLKWGLIGGAAWIAYEYFFAAPAAAVTAPPATTPPATTPPATTPPAPSSTYNTLTALFNRVTADAAAQNLTTQSPDAWNALFVQEGGNQIINGSLPDPVSLFGSHDPITLAQWWAGTSGWLATTKGLTGLGVFSGLGRLVYGGGY